MRQSYLADELRYEVVRPTLLRIHLYSLAAEELLLGIAAHETWLGALGRRQRGGGPGLGLWQMEGGKLADGKLTERLEGGTHRQTWKWMRRYKPQLAIQAAAIASPLPAEPETMVASDEYACVLARALMLADAAPLPDAYDIEGQGVWYLRVWRPARATVADYVRDYTRLVRPTGALK